MGDSRKAWAEDQENYEYDQSLKRFSKQSTEMVHLNLREIKFKLARLINSNPQLTRIGHDDLQKALNIINDML